MSEQIIEDVTRKLRQELATLVGSGVKGRIAPADDSFPFGEEAELPAVVIEGPEIRPDKLNMTVEETDTGTTNPEGSKVYELRRNRLEADFPITLHVWSRRMANDKSALRLCEKILDAAGELDYLTVDHGGGDVRTYRLEMEIFVESRNKGVQI